MTSLQTEFLLPGDAVRDAVDFFADADAETRGAVHTRPEVAEFILQITGWIPEAPLETYRLLEPSAGEGEFLLPAVERLLTRVAPDDSRIRGSVTAVEVNTAALEICRHRLLDLLQTAGWTKSCADSLLADWLVQADFLTLPLDGGFTHIVGNPPYVRLEHLPKDLLRLYRARWRSLFDRADLYVAFIEKSLGLLRPDGRIGFICADRWMKNRYGGPLRSLVAEGFHLQAYVDFTGCPAFFDEVDAYPAVTVIRRGKGNSTLAAFRPKVEKPALDALGNAILSETDHPEVTLIENVVGGAEPWNFDEDGSLSIIRGLEARFPTLESTGCRVGIGVATGADKVYIGTAETLDIEPARRLPLVTTRDIRNGTVEWSGKWVLNPFNDDGSLVDLRAYPKFAAYLEANRDAITRRNVAKRNPRGWFRTIDRIHAHLTNTPKLLIPDIKGSAHVVYDSGEYYPHHNLYYVTSESWPLRALQTVLSSRVAKALVAAYSPRMRGNFLRFQAQYLRRLRIPEWHRVDTALQTALVRAAETGDRKLAETSVQRLYRLHDAEWERLGGKLKEKGLQ